MKQTLTSVFLGLTALCYGFLGYGIVREDFYGLLGGYCVAFLGYGYVLWQYHTTTAHLEDRYSHPSSRWFTLSQLLWAAIGFRLIFLLSFPILSDDYFRFFWDGKLLANGLNPYLVLPSDFINTPKAQELGFSQELFQSLNSPDYYTVYPPVNQVNFVLGSWLFPNTILGAVVVMRLQIILAEAGSLYILWHLLPLLKLPRTASLLYALNPLVIVELSGNLHFEAVVLYFVLLAFYYLVKQTEERPLNLYLAGMFYAFGIAVKLVPLMLLPAFLRKLWWKQAFIFYAAIGLVVLALFLPFFNWQLIDNMLSSVNLYFKRFEFNASIYYLVRWWGFQEYGYNIIASSGQNLSKLALFLILLLAFSLHKGQPWKQVFGRMLFMMSVYYFLTTTVHPWYICNLVLLSVFTRYRFALWWSGMAVLSYAAYQSSSYSENLYLVALEYVVVYGVLLWEVFGWKR